MQFELDIVTEETSIDQTVTEVEKLDKSIKVIKVYPEGRGSGWPTIIVEAPSTMKETLSNWYGGEVS